MSKKALSYSRVSTKGQKDFGYSLETQVEGCRKYAAAHDLDIIAEMADDCSGTIPIADRPQGRKLYDLVDEGKVEAVILYTLDRTARDERVIEYLLFKAYLYDRGVELHYSDTGLDPYTMEGNLVGYIKAHGAADERKKIRERSMRGKLAKARSGKWVGIKAPYGYSKVGVKKDAILVIDEYQIGIVKRIYAMYLGLDGYRFHHMLEIAIALNAEKIPIPGKSKSQTQKWMAEVIRIILMNPAYIGEFRYKDLRVSLPHLAVIPRAMFEAAQERREKNAVQAKRNRKYDYLLAGGFIRCVCGRWMVGESTVKNKGGKRYFYYSCTSHHRREIYTDCQEPKIRADVAEQRIWEWVYGLLLDDTRLEAGISRMTERNEAKVSSKRERLEYVSGEISATLKAVERLSGALSESDCDEVSAALKVDLKNAGKKLNGLKEERARLESEIEQGTVTPEEIAQIKRTAAELREELTDYPMFELKRMLLNKFNLLATLQHTENGRQLEVTCALSVKPEHLPIETSYCRAGGCRPGRGRSAGSHPLAEAPDRGRQTA